MTALGMCSSMGDAFTACAAARAGLSRPGELPYAFFDPDAGEEAAVGHPVPELGQAQGSSRLIQLAWLALQDLLSREAEPLDERDVGLILCLPDPAERPAEDAPAPGSRAEAEQRRAAELAGSDVVNRVLALAGLDLPAGGRRAIARGQAGFAAAVSEALDGLAEGRWSTCLVGAVDSLVEEDTLTWLDQQERLKGAETPMGFMPGEAAAFLALQPAGARDRRRPPLAWVNGARTHQGQDWHTLDRPPSGRDLLALLEPLWAETGAPQAPVWVLTDQNGETARAHEWADLVLRARLGRSEVSSALLWYPAISFGDVGAAYGAVAACMVARAFARDYAPAGQAHVLASNLRGLKGAVSFSRPASR